MSNAPAPAAPPAAAPVDLRQLERSLRRPRSLFSFLMSVLVGVMTAIAVVPLVSVLWTLLYSGSRRLSIELFTQLPPGAGMEGGGIGNCIVGTLIMVGIASVISVPFGILAAVYLAEFGPDTRTASVVRFCAKVLTGLPSILAGVFAYVTVVRLTGFSPVAAGVALALLMLPTILLTAEEAIKAVPARMREAALGMGATKAQAIWYVILPAARPGILTGVMLAVARAAGETAPLLFAVLFSWYWLSSRFLEPTASLAVLIYKFSAYPYENQREIVWAASLVLVTIVLVLNVLGQYLAHRQAQR
jgi:phosphate transport system permease protein